MTRRDFARRLALGMMLAGVVPVAGATSGPAEVVLSVVATLRESLAGLPGDGADSRAPQVIEAVRAIVLPHIDVELSARLVLGRYWREATPAQRQAFIDAERDLLLQLYAIHALDYLDAEVEIVSTRSDDATQRAVVRTRVRRAGRPEVAVDYQLHGTDHGWKVFDAVVNGVSVVITLRNATGEDIRRLGLDGTIAQLRARLDQPQAPAP